MELTYDEHKEIHEKLHRHLDELFADFILHHPNKSGFTKLPILDLITWASEQAMNPIPDR